MFQTESSHVPTSSANERIQTVVFIRHGVATHNVPDPRTGKSCDYRDPYFYDPPLLLHGKIGAVETGSVVQEWFGRFGTKIELLVTSPLTRCIQTTTLAFVRGDEYCITKCHNNNKVHITTDPVNILCMEDLREAFGVHYPDKRREKSILMKHWPNIQFEDTMSEEDILWNQDIRETWDDVEFRICRFLEWLVKRSECNIVIVSHGVWIERLLRLHVPDYLGERRVFNLDSFACQILSSSDCKFLRIGGVQRLNEQN